MLDAEVLEGRAGVIAVTHDERVSVVAIDAECDRVRGSAQVLDALSRVQIPVDSVVWSSPPGIPLRMEFCVSDVLRDAAVNAVREALDCSVVVRRELARVSAVGTGLLSRPGLTALGLSALAAADIAAECVSCAQARTTFLVPRDRVHEAVTALYECFGLDEADITTPVIPA